MTTLHQLEARRDQLVADLCQLHLDELGAVQVGDAAGEAEAAALMDTVQRELAEVETAIAQLEEERARNEADHGPFTWSHPDINPRNRAHAAQPGEELMPPIVAPPSATEREIDAAWIDLCAARNDYHSLPHNAPPWMRRRDLARLERAQEAYERALARHT